MTKTIDESLDIIAQSLQLAIKEKQETNRLLRLIADRISWISGER